MSDTSHEVKRRPLAGDSEPIQIVIGDNYALKTIGDASASASSPLLTTGSLGTMTYALRVHVVDAGGTDIALGEYYIPMYAES